VYINLHFWRESNSLDLLLHSRSRDSLVWASIP